jgi:DNA replication protein DnaC
MPQPDCPRCGGMGWKLSETGQGHAAFRTAVRCDCAADERAARALARTRIPKRYEHCDFDNFDTDLYEVGEGAALWNRSLAQAKLVAESLARDYPVGTDAGLLLIGPCGAGKTHLAVAVLRALVLRGHGGLFYDYRELLKEIQASYNPISQTTEISILEPVLMAEVLLLDDLGAGKPSAWVLETVGHILNTRYNEKRITLLTTNYVDFEPDVSANLWTPPGTQEPRGKDTPLEVRGSPSARPSWRPGLDGPREDSLADRIGHRIRSRLYEMCRTLEVTAPDYRKEIRQAGRLRS